MTVINTSEYWSLIYTTMYTIHAGALETITIDGVYGSFTTNADGTVNHALPLGELILHGSVSGKSFTRTVTKETTDVYVMPEGALYWYGNECTNLTGGWGTTTYGSSALVTKNANDIYIHSYRASIYTINTIDMTNYEKAKVHFSTIKGRNSSDSKFGSVYLWMVKTLVIRYAFPIKNDGTDDDYIVICDTSESETSIHNKTVNNYILTLNKSGDIPTPTVSVTIDCSESAAYTYMDALWLE